jgi:cell division septation protein DedD
MATREGELFKDKIEVSLDGRQIFCLFCGGAVIASLVFVLGVMVGRRVESRANPERAAAGSPASDPLAALDQLAADGESDTATDAQLPSALRDGHAAPPAPVDQALAHPTPPPEPPAAKPARPEPVVARPEPPAKAEPPAARPEPPEPVAKPPEPPKPEAKGGRYTLQLSSFQSKAEADAFIAELKKSGYAPTMTEANVEGKGTWFRVRVGGYASYDEAVAAKSEFESKQKIIAYVTRVK